MSLNLIIRHWSNLQTTEHAVEPSEAVSALISNLIAYYGLQDSPQDQISLATPTGTVLDPSASFIQTGVSNGDELILGPYSFVSMHKPAQAPAPVSRRVILRIREHDGRKIRLNDTDAQNLRVDDGDLVRLRDELSGTFAVGQAEIAPEVSPGEVEMDPMTMDCLGAGPDQEIVADRYPVETLKSLTQITLGIKPVGAREDQDLLIRIRSRESELARSMNRRVVINGQKFRWKEMDLIVQVLETDPPLTGEEVGMVSIDRLKGFSYRLSTDEVSFDGILLIDMSFSMEKEDLEVQNVQHALDYMANALTGPATQAFLHDFREGSPVERHRGAVLAALMYLAGKVSRGKGERIAVILFSDQPVTVSFGHSQYFDAATAGRDVNKIAEAIISSVENIKKRSTRMGPALKSSLDLARMFDQKRPKMLVMLTDGRPDDAELAEQMVYQSIANRKDMILFIAGMGEEVDQDLMQRWAGATGGEYIHVKDLNQLADWYSSLAKKLTFRADMDNLNRNGVR